MVTTTIEVLINWHTAESGREMLARVGMTCVLSSAVVFRYGHDYGGDGSKPPVPVRASSGHLASRHDA